MGLGLIVNGMSLPLVLTNWNVYSSLTLHLSDALQKLLFPSSYFDRTATERLRPGQPRLHMALKIFLEITKPLTFRIPTREASKVSPCSRTLLFFFVPHAI